ncbi:hypothetical protein SAMN04488109_1611 [Chryseolinea serpens]|uniref:Uncharacterized protein n=1 Tax=Chryseolinea serpens TaxID=947013 RepID=A0A1M5M8H1_9BACT|nr:hypothetical protein SAMN04488109_1611 [Chryseolinea serpens]
MPAEAGLINFPKSNPIKPIGHSLIIDEIQHYCPSLFTRTIAYRRYAHGFCSNNMLNISVIL